MIKWLRSPFSFALASIAILLSIVFLNFPIMGHDYAYSIPMLKDLRTAWSEFGVFNPHFTPSRCLGVPMWANPSAFNLGLAHFLVLVFGDLFSLALFLAIVSGLSFYGAYQFARQLKLSESWACYIAFAWSLQGGIVLRATVGHMSYALVGLFPLILVLLSRSKTLARDVLTTIGCALVLTQYVFMSAPYLLIFLAIGSLLLIGLMFLWKDARLQEIDWKHFTVKLFSATLVFLLAVGPRLQAILDFMVNYRRERALEDVGVLATLPYAILSNLSFWPHDFTGMIEWNYGNWESVQFAFPALMVLVGWYLLRTKDERSFKLLYASLAVLIVVSALFCSGLLRDVLSQLPVLSSMHANPRWNLITILPLLYLAIKAAETLSNGDRRIYLSLFLLAGIVPFLHIDRINLQINYPYDGARAVAQNRLAYCYEPIFGYRLEEFPIPGGKVDFLNAPLFDPRCYLQSSKCRPGSPISGPDLESLQKYQLR